MIEKTLWKYPGRRSTGVAAILAAVMVAGMPTLAQAQTGGQQAAATYDIGAQPLAAALAAWSTTSGIRVQSLPDAARASQSASVNGSLGAVVALDTLLQGTGYSFRFTRVDAVVIEPVPTTGLGAVLGTVRVQGTTDIATQGVNGSTDPTATEGSDSYAADQTTVATKMPLSLKETPQSVSVVTQQQLRDRNVTDFQRALMEAPGISTVYGSSGGSNAGRSNLQPTFFSRGFQISRLQIDGGAPLTITPYTPSAIVPQLNMAAYDHIEILRGADGLFDGAGDPGGAINLTRKRPLDHQQLLVSQLFESFNGFNTTVDGSSPIAFDGNLRARVVLNRQSNDYFYDTAKNKQFMIYGTLEAQITPSTLISGGINYQSQDAVPFMNGLPGGLVDGKVVDLHLARSTCFCFDFNRQSYDTREFFGRAEQSFGRNWKLTVNGSTSRQLAEFSYAGVVGTVGTAEPNGSPRLSDAYGKTKSTQYTLDGNLTGAFTIFGQRQSIVVGGNYSSFDGGGQESYRSAYRFLANAPLVDVYNFNQADYVEPNHSEQASIYTPINRTENLGAYATLRLTPVKPLHFTVGMRYNRFSGRSRSYQVCRNEFGCFDQVSGDFVDTGVAFGDLGEIKTSTARLFPAGYLAAALDVTSTVSAYVSRTAIYIDNSLYVDVDENSLSPTTGNNYEGGLKYASADHRLTASAVAFYLKQKGSAIFDSFDNPNVDPLTGKLPNGKNCCYINDPDSERRSKGVDVEIAGEVYAGLQVSASYVYNKTKNIFATTTVTEPLESQAPRHLYKAWLKYTFQPKSALKGGYIGLGLEGQSEGSAQGRVCVAADEYSCTDYEIASARLAPRAILSLQTGWEFDRRFSVAVTINNLLDKRYYASVGITDGGNWYGAPRNVAVALRGAF